MTRGALFLDRDGVININHGHVHKVENFDFKDGIFDLVRKANELNMPVVIITNQGGIGRGLYTEKVFHKLMNWVLEQFQKENAYIDGVYFCPYHPEHGVGKYKRSSKYRKPEPGMIIKAAKDHHIDLSRSVIVGDKSTDMKAGELAGVAKLYLFSETEKYIGAEIILDLSQVKLVHKKV